MSGAKSTELMIEIAIQAAKEAGGMLRDNFLEHKTSFSLKDSGQNTVTESDIVAEKIIINKIRSAYPEHSIFSEEAGMESHGVEYLWIIDPLDGTTNFGRSQPYFNVSIGLLHNKKPVLGVVYQPITDELFTAETGKGAYCNGKRIKVSTLSKISQSVVLMNRASTKQGKQRLVTAFAVLNKVTRSMRYFGAIALDLCYVASGRFDAVVVNECKRYDCAAGNIIAQEAGAVTSDFSGNAFDWTAEASDLLVTTPGLQQDFIGILKEI